MHALQGWYRTRVRYIGQSEPWRKDGKPSQQMAQVGHGVEMVNYGMAIHGYAVADSSTGQYDIARIFSVGSFPDPKLCQTGML